jgi:hypothetical protein
VVQFVCDVFEGICEEYAKIGRTRIRITVNCDLNWQAK